LINLKKTLSEYREFLDLPQGHIKIHTLNMFANENIRLLRAIHNETTIVMYLEGCAHFRGPLGIPGAKTRIHLQTMLLDYTTPGAPYYPTRKIRKQAKKTLDTVFPSGKRSRLATNWVFRFLSPIELFRSWWFWTVAWITAFVLIISNLLFKVSAHLPHTTHEDVHKKESGAPPVYNPLHDKNELTAASGFLAKKSLNYPSKQKQI